MNLTSMRIYTTAQNKSENHYASEVWQFSKKYLKIPTKGRRKFKIMSEIREGFSFVISITGLRLNTVKDVGEWNRKLNIKYCMTAM